MRSYFTSYFLLFLQFIGFNLIIATSCAQPSILTKKLPEHTIKIRDNRVDKRSDYEALSDKLRLDNEIDTIFVEKIHSEDMGHIYNVGYSLREKTPDGIYRFFVNDTISSEITLVNGKAEGIYKSYLNGNLREETPFHLGVTSGYSKTYSWFSPYNVNLIAYYYQDKVYLMTGFDATGNVVSRSYFMPGSGGGGPYRKEDKESGLNYSSSPLTQNGKAVINDSPRNGLYELASYVGKYQLFFKNDLVQWWKFLDKDGKLVVEVHAKPGQLL